MGIPFFVACGVIYLILRFVSLIPRAFFHYNQFGRRTITMYDSALTEQLIKGLAVLSVTKSVGLDMSASNSDDEIAKKLNIYIKGKARSDQLEDDMVNLYNRMYQTKMETLDVTARFINIVVFRRNKNGHYKMFIPRDFVKDRSYLLFIDDHPKRIDLKYIEIITKEQALVKLFDFNDSSVLFTYDEFYALIETTSPPMDPASPIQYGFKRAHPIKKRNVVARILRVIANEGATLSRTGTRTISANRTKAEKALYARPKLLDAGENQLSVDHTVESQVVPKHPKFTAMVAAANQMFDVGFRIISLLPKAYLNLNAFGRRIIRFNDAGITERFIKCTVVLKYAQNQHLGILSNDSMSDVIVKINSRISDVPEALIDFYNYPLHDAKGKFYTACSQHMNIAIFNKNQSNHYSLDLKLVDSASDWLMLVDDVPWNDSLISIGILTESTRLFQKINSTIGNILFEKNIFCTLLEKYKPKPQNKTTVQHLSELKIQYINAEKKPMPTDGWLVHNIKRAFGRAKKAVRVIRNDGATLSRTSTYTNAAGRNTLAWELHKIKWGKINERYYQNQRLRQNTELKDLRDRRTAKQQVETGMT